MTPIWKATAAPSAPTISFFMSRPLLTGWRTARECPIGRAGARETLKAAIRRSRESGTHAFQIQELGPRLRGADFFSAGGDFFSLLAPDLARGLDAEAELGLFLLDGEVVAVVSAGEAALRADAEVFHRHEPGGGFDPSF